MQQGEESVEKFSNYGSRHAFILRIAGSLKAAKPVLFEHSNPCIDECTGNMLNGNGLPKENRGLQAYITASA